MNKAELITAVAEKAELSKKDTEAVVNATVEVIFDKESEEVLMIVVTKAAPDEK